MSASNVLDNLKIFCRRGLETMFRMFSYCPRLRTPGFSFCLTLAICCPLIVQAIEFDDIGFDEEVNWEAWDHDPNRPPSDPSEIEPTDSDQVSFDTPNWPDLSSMPGLAPTPAPESAPTDILPWPQLLPQQMAPQNLDLNIDIFGHTQEGGLRIPIADDEELDRRPRMVIDLFIRPSKLGLGREAVVVRMDGQFRLAGVMSSALPNKPAVRTGEFWAKIPSRKRSTGGTVSTYLDNTDPYLDPYKVPYPFTVSRKFKGSPMYWGFNVYAGIWAHSTNHSRALGRPDSNGCLRMSLPTAMAIWKMAMDEARGNVRLHIHRGFTTGARNTLNEIETMITHDDLIKQIKSDYLDANRPELLNREGNFREYWHGHARRGGVLEFPSCGPTKSCFKHYGVKVRYPRKDKVVGKGERIDNKIAAQMSQPVARQVRDQLKVTSDQLQVTPAAWLGKTR
jgi:hypothetical protein